MNLLKYDKGIYDVSRIDGIRYWAGDFKGRYREYCATVELNGNCNTIERKLFNTEHQAEAYYMSKIEKVMMLKLNPNKGSGMIIWEEL